MLSVMIVDDERIDREAYRLMIEKNLPELHIAAEADNGAAAIEKSIEHKPDILLLDIKMPGMTGLEVMRFIRSSIPDIQILILSAYDYFEYAKEAIRMGVAGYLVKPVSEQELIGELRQVIARIEEQKHGMIQKLHMARAASSITPAVNRGIFQALRGHDAKMLELLLGVLNKRLDSGYIIVGTPKDPRMEIPKEPESGVWDNDTFFGGFGRIGGHLMYFLVGEEAEDVKAERALGGLTEEIGRRLGVRLLCSVSEKYNNAGELRERFFETLMACWKVHKMVSGSREPIGYGQFRESSGQLLAVVSEKREAESRKLFLQLSGGITDSPREDLPLLKFLFYDLYRSIARMGIKQELAEAVGQEERYDSAENYEEFYREFLRAVGEVCRVPGLQEHIGYPSRMAHILDYLEKNYCKELTLNQAASDLYLSPGHLGKLLREATGMNFTEYLTGLRLQKAKKLLEETDQSIGEISDAVGYRDPNYFIKVFKKSTESTPQRYRKKIRWEAQFRQT